jgi:hypothetical protein
MRKRRKTSAGLACCCLLAAAQAQSARWAAASWVQGRTWYLAGGKSDPTDAFAFASAPNLYVLGKQILELLIQWPATK